MTSGVIRHSVRSRLPWRMISWPAANEMRWVNPSIATASPSRTISRTASAIEATLDDAIASDRGFDAGDRVGGLGGVEDWLLGALPRDLGDRLAEDPQRRRHLGLGDREGRRHADGALPAFEDEQPALEARPLDLLGVLGRVELDADHQPATADVANELGEAAAQVR